MNSTAGVLVDPKLDLDFRRDGVVKLQLFDDSEVQELWKIFNKYKNEIKFLGSYVREADDI